MNLTASRNLHKCFVLFCPLKIIDVANPRTLDYFINTSWEIKPAPMKLSSKIWEYYLNVINNLTYEANDTVHQVEEREFRSSGKGTSKRQHIFLSSSFAYPYNKTKLLQSLPVALSTFHGCPSRFSPLEEKSLTTASKCSYLSPSDSSYYSFSWSFCCTSPVSNKTPSLPLGTHRAERSEQNKHADDEAWDLFSVDIFNYQELFRKHFNNRGIINCFFSSNAK